jgi:Zn-dependent M28 family amino/carboxypeptidase
MLGEISGCVKGLEMQAFKNPARITLVMIVALLISSGPANGQGTKWSWQREFELRDQGFLKHYTNHVRFLADPALEGRGPGTKGNATAAEYIEREFERTFLKSSFPKVPAEKTASPEAGTFRSEFFAGNGATERLAVLSGQSDNTQDALGSIKDGLHALGFSASGKLSLPIVFVGYSIDHGGPNKTYSSYPKDAAEKPLNGAIALILRFEPMDEHGKSLWKAPEDTLWSSAAALPDKINAAISRGAAGIILVSPPNCDDPRSKKLESAEATVRWMRTLDVPAIMMSSEAADTLVRARDPEHRTLLQLRELADKEGGLVPLGKDPVRLEVDLDRTPRTTWNIAGTLPGRGKLKDQYIIIGAHYDHVGYGYTGGSRSDEYGLVHPGADDNASGASGLLLAAEKLKRRYDFKENPFGPPKPNTDPDLRSIMFVAFSAEEMGLIGSREFMKACPIEAKNIDCMLNMDMIGRLRGGKVEISGTGTAEGFADLLKPIFDTSGLTIAASPGGRGPSDHATFYGAGIPVLHFFTGMHDQYHTPRDTVDLINCEGAVQVVGLVTNIAYTLAAREAPLAFLSTDKKKGEEDGKPKVALTGMKVRFGIAPGNYADGDAGILVGEVFPGTCAAEAGILPGDRLIRWNGKEIGDVQSWMEMMAPHKPGDTVDLDVKRKGEEIRVRATLKSRDQAPK